MKSNILESIETLKHIVSMCSDDDDTQATIKKLANKVLNPPKDITWGVNQTLNKELTPRYTVLFNIISADGYLSRGKEFFDDLDHADSRFLELRKTDGVPTRRPWNELADRPEYVTKLINSDI